MRKKIVLISLIVGFCFLGLFCYKSWIITFVITKYLSGGTDGKEGIVKSIIIPWRNYQFHLHHWFIALLIGGVCVVKGFYILAPEVSYGFLSAIIFQGIYCYGDWYRIIRKQKRSANSGAANVGLATNRPVSQVVLQRSALLS